MTRNGLSIANGARALAAVEPRPSVPRMDFTTALFTGLSASVFLILLGCVVTAAVLFSQGI